MEESKGDRTFISIGLSKGEHENIMESLLNAHAVSGCDTVPQMYGIGKKTILGILRKHVRLSFLGDTEASLDSIISECCKFVAACYGVHNYTTMSDARFDLWNKKILSKSSPKLKSLPPTLEVLSENIKRAHLQAAIWRSSDSVDPPMIDPCDYGWYKDEENKSLMPVMFPVGAKPAPDNVLKLICCTCSSVEPCQTARCSCNKAQMSCSKFCLCFKEDEDNTCYNKWTFLAGTIESDNGNDNDNDM